MSVNELLVAEVRQFNRFYTGMLGLLNQHILDSRYSLSEVRVLYEIAHTENCTAGQLTALMQIDGGYLSRILKAFEKDGMVLRRKSPSDGRTFYLQLSAKGKKMMASLDEQSSGQIAGLLAPLAPFEQGRVQHALQTIRELLSGKQEEQQDEIVYRHQLLPGDVGYLIYLHGELYARETGYNLEFEQYVCKTFYEFLDSYSPSKDRVFLAIHQHRIVGAVAILGASRHLAQLRWFLVHPDFRGKGVGKKLIEDALAFCREKNYQKVYLLTTSMQTTAIGLYVKMGFRKTGEKYLQQWGQQLYEQRYDMDLV